MRISATSLFCFIFCCMCLRRRPEKKRDFSSGTSRRLLIQRVLAQEPGHRPGPPEAKKMSICAAAKFFFSGNRTARWYVMHCDWLTTHSHAAWTLDVRRMGIKFIVQCRSHRQQSGCQSLLKAQHVVYPAEKARGGHCCQPSLALTRMSRIYDDVFRSKSSFDIPFLRRRPALPRMR